MNLFFQVRPHLQTLLNDLSLVFFFLVHLFLRVAFDDGGPLRLRHTDSFIRCHWGDYLFELAWVVRFLHIGICCCVHSSLEGVLAQALRLRCLRLVMVLHRLSTTRLLGVKGCSRHAVYLLDGDNALIILFLGSTGVAMLLNYSLNSLLQLGHLFIADRGFVSVNGWINRFDDLQVKRLLRGHPDRKLIPELVEEEARYLLPLHLATIEPARGGVWRSMIDWLQPEWLTWVHLCLFLNY